MMYAPLETLVTPRLCLRRQRLADAPLHFQRLARDPAVAAGMLWDPRDDCDAVRADLAHTLAGYDTGRLYRWAIALRENDEQIGVIQLVRLDETQNTAGFAYMLGRDFWGRGYAAEALTAVLGFAFGRLGLGCIAADHFADNPASGRAMEKAGLRRLGVLPGKYQKHGVRHDAVQYAITREEFEKMRPAPRLPGGTAKEEYR